MVEAGAGHAFAEAAFLDKVRFQAANQLVEEVVGLVEEPIYNLINSSVFNLLQNRLIDNVAS